MSERSALPDGTVPGPVHLAVRDLEREARFYREALGFRLRGNGGAVHGAAGRIVRLGTGRHDLVLLEERPDAVLEPGAAGLFHVAILYPSRRDLAEAILRLERSGGRIEGGSDHLVSEAVYLTDPEGNGIELYRDRPKNEWYGPDGRIRMATLPLDLEGLLAEASPDADALRASRSIPGDVRIGHVHLRVLDVAASERFYTEGLGMSLMLRFGPQAGFVSAGGYHHHVGFNSWDRPRLAADPDRHAGLAAFILVLPDHEALGSALDRLRRYREVQPGAVTEPEEGGSGGIGWVEIRDPSGIRLRLEVSVTG